MSKSASPGSETTKIDPQIIYDMMQQGQWGTPQGYQSLLTLLENMTTQEEGGASGRGGKSSADPKASKDPFGWADYLAASQAARPQTMYQMPTGLEGFLASGAPTSYEPRTFGNVPYGTTLNIPTLQALQALGVTSSLASQGLSQLTPRYTSNQMSGAPRAVNPYYAAATAGQLGDNPDFNRYITPDEYAALANIPATARGLDLEQYLPASLQGQGTEAEVAALQDLSDQYQAAYQANPTDQFVRQQYVLANQALQSAKYGPMWGSLQSMTATDLAQTLRPNTDLLRDARPLTKGDYAAQWGYGTMSNPRTGMTNDPTQKRDFANTLQTLRAAGWTPDKGYGPQESWGTLSSGAERPASQQAMLNDLLYSVSPTTSAAKQGVLANNAEADPNAKPATQMYDPNAAMNAAIERDAYVQETLGGGVYGGVIPEQEDYRYSSETRGDLPDPFWPVPQREPDGTPIYYPGWGSSQATQFGQQPYDAFAAIVNNPLQDPGYGPFTGNMTWSNSYQPPTSTTTGLNFWNNAGNSWGNIGGNSLAGNAANNTFGANNNNTFGGNTRQLRPAVNAWGQG